MAAVVERIGPASTSPTSRCAMLSPARARCIETGKAGSVPTQAA
jgi:hypothetical protein